MHRRPSLPSGLSKSGRRSRSYPAASTAHCTNTSVNTAHPDGLPVEREARLTELVERVRRHDDRANVHLDRAHDHLVRAEHNQREADRHTELAGRKKAEEPHHASVNAVRHSCFAPRVGPLRRDAHFSSAPIRIRFQCWVGWLRNVATKRPQVVLDREDRRTFTRRHWPRTSKGARVASFPQLLRG
jgi:hypothetical protein